MLNLKLLIVKIIPSQSMPHRDAQRNCFECSLFTIILLNEQTNKKSNFNSSTFETKMLSQFELSIIDWKIVNIPLNSQYSSIWFVLDFSISHWIKLLIETTTKHFTYELFFFVFFFTIQCLYRFKWNYIFNAMSKSLIFAPAN